MNLETENLKSVQLLKTYTANPFHQSICGFEYGLGSRWKRWICWNAGTREQKCKNDFNPQLYKC